MLHRARRTTVQGFSKVIGSGLSTCRKMDDCWQSQNPSKRPCSPGQQPMSVTPALNFSIPVWFVLEGENLYLLPVQGSDTQWYRNVLKNPQIRVDARGVEAEFRAMPITEMNAVKSVVEKFREKYGAKDVKKYYSIFDVAVVAAIR
jgi:hypothetical protein